MDGMWAQKMLIKNNFSLITSTHKKINELWTNWQYFIFIIFFAIFAVKQTGQFPVLNESLLFN